MRSLARSRRRQAAEKTAEALLADPIRRRGIEVAHAEREGPLQQGQRALLIGDLGIGEAPGLADPDGAEPEFDHRAFGGCALRYHSSVQPHAFFEREARRVAQIADGERGIGLRIAHVAGARRSVVRGDVDAFQLLQQRPGLIERDASAVAAVVDLAGDAIGARGLQIQLGHVFHVGEVARLLAIAENRRRRAIQRGLHEEREHAGVRAARDPAAGRTH